MINDFILETGTSLLTFNFMLFTFVPQIVSMTFDFFYCITNLTFFLILQNFESYLLLYFNTDNNVQNILYDFGKGIWLEIRMQQSSVIDSGVW